MAKERAFGAKLLLQTGSGPVTWQEIGNIRDIEGPTKGRESIDVTTHDSPFMYAEKLPGVKDGGSLTFDVEWITPATPTSSHVVGLINCFESDALKQWALMLPGGKVSGFGSPAATEDADCWKFDGFITKISTQLPVAGSHRASIEVTISGKPAYTGADMTP